MRRSKHIVGVSLLCELSACSGIVRSDPEPARKPPVAAPEADIPAADASRAQDGPLIRGSVSGTFPMTDVTQCQPLGLPLTDFLSGVFFSDNLVSESATPISNTECLHAQVLQGSADLWATLAYTVLCRGGGDARLCGTAATRLCSVEQMMQWAANGSEAIPARDPSLGFEYLVSTPDNPSRLALYRRTQQEVHTLLDEAASVMSDEAAGTRHCPDETPEGVAAAYAEGAHTGRLVDDILDGCAPDGAPTNL